VVTTDIFASLTTDVLCIGEQLPFEDEQFDYVLCFAVLEHTRRPWEVATAMCRVLKPGGRVIVDYPFMQPVHAYPHHYFNATATGHESLFKQACEIVSVSVPLHLEPIYGLSWILSIWKSALPPKDAAAFGQLTVNQLAAPPHEQTARSYCTNLPEDMRGQIAAGSRLIAVKKTGCS
jgi:SAM-dependent methyltransferase